MTVSTGPPGAGKTPVAADRKHLAQGARWISN